MVIAWQKRVRQKTGCLMAAGGGVDEKAALKRPHSRRCALMEAAVAFIALGWRWKSGVAAALCHRSPR